MINEVFHDLDDTLILTTPHYEKAILDTLKVIEFYIGHDKFPALEYLVKKHKEIDTELRKEHQVMKKRFTESLIRLYKHICNELEVDEHEEAINPIKRHSSWPFSIKVYGDPKLMPGAEETLDFLVEKGCKLRLYTKGGSYQIEKIKYFKLDRWFKEAPIIVEHKTSEDITKNVDDLDKAIFITDSLSDVLVGIEAGIRVVHIPLPEVYSNSFDNDVQIPESSLYHRVNSLSRFKAILSMFKANYHSM